MVVPPPTQKKKKKKKRSFLFFIVDLSHCPMQEKLWSMLRDVMKNNKPNVDVVKLQKSGGVVNRNAKFRQKARSYRIRVSRNFYGYCVCVCVCVYVFSYPYFV